MFQRIRPSGKERGAGAGYTAPGLRARAMTSLWRRPTISAGYPAALVGPALIVRQLLAQVHGGAGADIIEMGFEEAAGRRAPHVPQMLEEGPFGVQL